MIVALISLAEAAMKNIDRVRLPKWGNTLDHLKIDIIDRSPGLGPWVHLYSPFNLECNGRDPVSLIAVISNIDIHAREWEAYTGPLPDSEQYKTAAATFIGSLARAEGKE